MCAGPVTRLCPKGKEARQRKPGKIGADGYEAPQLDPLGELLGGTYRLGNCTVGLTSPLQGFRVTPIRWNGVFSPTCRSIKLVGESAFC